MKYKCRLCLDSESDQILNLGNFNPANLTGHHELLELIVSVCISCGVVQIPRRFKKEINFPKEYKFRTSQTTMLKNNLNDLQKKLSKLLKPRAKILEIGCNDGYLLNILKAEGFDVLGIEPTDAVNNVPQNIRVIKDFFENINLNEIFDAIILTNTFAHLDDPRATLKKMKRLLAHSGSLILEVIDFDAMVKLNEFDKFTHEHGFYFTKETLDNLLNSEGFTCEFSEQIPTHGGSLRLVYTLKNSKHIRNSELYKKNVAGLVNLQKRSELIRVKILEYISMLKKDNFKIYLAGGNTRGMTLIKFLDIDTSLFEAVLEHPESPRIGEILPNLNLPVISDYEITRKSDTAIFILAWHVANEIMDNLSFYGFKGPFIVPLPDPQLIAK